MYWYNVTGGSLPAICAAVLCGCSSWDCTVATTTPKRRDPSLIGKDLREFLALCLCHFRTASLARADAWRDSPSVLCLQLPAHVLIGVGSMTAVYGGRINLSGQAGLPRSCARCLEEGEIQNRVEHTVFKVPSWIPRPMST